MIQNPFEQILQTIQPVDYRSADYDNQDTAFRNLSQGNTQSISDLVDNAMTDRVLKQASLVAQGDKYLALGELYAAGYSYSSAAEIGVQENPLTPYTLESKIKLSYAQMKTGGLEEARQTLENLPRENRNSIDVRYSLAHIYEGLHKQHKDITTQGQTTSSAVNYLTNNLGISILELQNQNSQTPNYLDVAIRELKAILRSSPLETKALNFLGYLYDKKGDLKKAIASYQKSFETQPNKSLSNRLKVLYNIQSGKQHSPNYKRARMYTQVAPLINEGIRLKSEKKYSEAQEKFNQALLATGVGVGLNPGQNPQELLNSIMNRIHNGDIQRTPDDALLLKAYLSIWNLAAQEDQRVIPHAIKELATINKLYPIKETSHALADYYHSYSK